MPEYWFPKPYADRVARMRVPCGFILVAAFAWFSDPNARALAVGIPISIVGLWIRAWAAGHLAKNQRLATAGPYAYVRNPLYIGTLLVAVGLAVASRSVGLAVLFATVFLLIYLPVIELEEQHLRKIFPEYSVYAKRVHRLLPTWPLGQDGERFQIKVFLRNQEYQAWLGFLAGAALLVWKAWRKN